MVTLEELNNSVGEVVSLCKQPFLDEGDLREIYLKSCELNNKLVQYVENGNDLKVFQVNCALTMPKFLLNLTEEVFKANNALLDKVNYKEERPEFNPEKFVLEKEVDAFTLCKELYQNLCLVLKTEGVESKLAFSDISVEGMDGAARYRLLEHVREANETLRGKLHE